MKSLNGKIIWLTGASSGIGAALAKELATHHCRLILSARSEEGLQKTREELRDIPDENIRVIPLDLSKSSSFEAVFNAIKNDMGPIDILINNAGVSQRSLAIETDFEVYRNLMEVNFFGTVLLTKTVLADMIARSSGQIVTITSIAGKLGTPWRTGYSAAKHALHGFYDSLRAEVHKHGIRVTLVAPGFVRTDVSMNALTGSGLPLGVMDEAQAKGMPPSKCAKIIVKAIRKEKNEVLIGGREVLAAYVQRFFPGILARIIRNVKVR